MIYQLKVTLKYTKPPIWRRLQVDSQTTFRQLHDILQIAFDWEGSHLHAFSTSKIPDNKRESEDDLDELDLFSILEGAARLNGHAEISDPESQDGFGLFFDEKKETLAEWMLEEKDKITYTYDFGDNWEHIIVLEEIFQPQTGVHYPQCVKVRHVAPEEDSRGEWLEEDWSDAHPEHKSDAKLDQSMQQTINECFRRHDNKLAVQAFSESQNRHDSLENWRLLFELADQFKQLKPWEWMSDVDWFAVVDPVQAETGYCCVLGNGGETFGLAVYVGEEGFRSLIELVNGGEESDPFQQRSMLLSFDNRADLSNEDYRLIKELGLSYRGRNAWPSFRSLIPGYYPWTLVEEEVQFFITVLEQAIEVCERVKVDPGLLESGEHRLFARLPKEAGHGFVWEDGFVSDAVKIREQEVYLYVPNNELEHIRQAFPIQQRALECDVSYFPDPVQDEKGQRPYFLCLYLCVDLHSGLIIDNEMVHHEQAIAAFQNKFVQLIQKMGYIPEVIHIENEMTYRMLVPLTEQLGIELVRSELSNIHAIKSEMF